MTHPGSGNPVWQNYPSTTTPITAAALENLEGAVDAVAGRLVQVRASANQSLTVTGWLPVALPLEDVDDLDGHSTTTNTARVTLPQAGLYRVSGQVMWLNGTSTANPLRQACLRTNGDVVLAGSIVNNQYAGNYMTQTIPPILLAAAGGTYVELTASTGQTDAVLFASPQAGSRMLVELVRSG